jgi:GrpB-like predicted nucleotidyltransferase (UPF0157 family)
VFETVCEHVWPAVRDVALRIDHVGSTAVPGLAAKPIIDMDVVVTSDGDIPQALERLASVGYRWRGDLGVRGREAVKLRRRGTPPSSGATRRCPTGTWMSTWPPRRRSSPNC